MPQQTINTNAGGDTIKVGFDKVTANAQDVSKRHAIPASDYGVVAGSGTDQTTNINNALDAASTQGGGKVVIDRPGVYLVDGVTIPSNVTLELYPGVTLKHRDAATAAAAVLTASGAVRAFLVGAGEVDGNRINQVAPASASAGKQGVRLVSAVRSGVEGVFVHDTQGVGISLFETTRSHVFGAFVQKAGFKGIALQSGLGACWYTKVSECDVYDVASGGIEVHGVAHHTLFENCTVELNGTDPTITADAFGGYNAANTFISVVGCTSRNSGNHACHLGGQRLLVSGFTAYNPNQHGVFFWNDDDTTCFDGAVSGVVVHDTVNGDGVFFDRCQRVEASAVSVNIAARHGFHARNCAVVGASAVHSFQSGSHGVRLNGSSDVDLVGCKGRNSTGAGLYGTDSTEIGVTGGTYRSNSTWGILSDGTSQLWVVQGAKLRSNTSGPTSLVAANNVVGNNITA